jgi:hypothetical protein
LVPDSVKLLRASSALSILTVRERPYPEHILIVTMTIIITIIIIVIINTIIVIVIIIMIIVTVITMMDGWMEVIIIT